MKQNKSLIVVILTLPILLSACGGGNGSSANTDTTINGIAVPPEPDATLNNATVAGVDSNNNGVRDDVERKIATSSQDQQIIAAKLLLAKAIQNDLLGQASISDQDFSNALCVIAKYGSRIDIDTLVINNAARQKADYSRKINREMLPCQ